MIEPVLKSITRYSMLAPGDRVIVAVSGGPDSVCLLHVLFELSERLQITLAVAHFNHKLRGEASDLDENFVAKSASDLGLPFYRAEADIRGAGGNLEQTARRARRAFFASLIQDAGVTGVTRVALGHTRDDQAETVLFRLLRGSGLTGLAGVLPVTADGIVRPLISVTRAAVLEYLNSRGLTWREDATNSDPRFARNRIRHELLPRLKQDWNPQLTDSLAHLADLAYEEERFSQAILDRLAATDLEVRAGGVEFRASLVIGRPRALARRMIRRAVSLARGDLRQLQYSHVEAVLDLAGNCVGGGRLALPGLVVTRSFDWLRIAPRIAPAAPVAGFPEVLLTVPGEFPIPGGDSRLKTEWVAAGEPDSPCDTLRAADGVVEIRANNLRVTNLGDPLTLRGWNPGDHYRPVGCRKDRKIKDLFQQARIPSWRRRLWPIVTVGDRILWARQFGPAAEFAADGTQVRCLRLVEIGDGRNESKTAESLASLFSS